MCEDWDDALREAKSYKGAAGCVQISHELSKHEGKYMYETKLEEQEGCCTVFT
jgi:hypothetical protein